MPDIPATPDNPSAEEWLDIVNDQDEVIGAGLRADIHQQQLLHRSAHVLLTNSAGHIFVQLRSMTKDSNPGLWDTSAAGHVDRGETYLQCAVRELGEELGVVADAADFQLIGSLEPSAANGFEFTALYQVCSDQQLTLDPVEVADGRWVSPADLTLWIEQRPADFTRAFLTIKALAEAVI